MAAIISSLDKLVKSWRGVGGIKVPNYFKKSSPTKKVANTIVTPLKKEGENIKQEEERIAQTLRSLRRERKKLTQRKKEFLERSKKWGEEKERIAADIKAIKNKLPVRVMRVIKETVPSEHPVILAETKTLTAKIDEKKRRIGKFLIRLDPFAKDTNDKIRVANFWKRVFRSGEFTYYDHPHISNSKLCAGNIYEDLVEVFEKREIFNLVMLVISFLRTTHTGEPYIGWDDWLDQARPLPEGANLFPNRDYSLLNKEGNKLCVEGSYIFADGINSNATVAWTGIEIAPSIVDHLVGWEEYIGGPEGIRIGKHRAIIQRGEDEQVAELRILRNRIKELSRELVELKRGGRSEGATIRSAICESATSAYYPLAAGTTGGIGAIDW